MKTMTMGVLAAAAMLFGSVADAQQRTRTELGASTSRTLIVQSLATQPTNPAITEVSAALAVEFEFGKADLTPMGRVVVDVLAQALNSPELMPYTFLAEGHTDAVGSEQTNLTLSQRRAETVRAALAQRGVDPVRLTTAGFGELRLLPGIPGDAARNRRVEVVRRVN